MHKEFLDFAIDLAHKVGELQLVYFRSDRLHVITKSNHADVVTLADKECEELIARTVFERYPDHKILGEEGGFRGNENSEYLWVVDPIDGTTNYSQGLSYFTCSIALQHKGETIVGVVYAPYVNELFAASKGGGAYMAYRGGEMKPIRVSDKQSLCDSVVATGFPYDKDVNPDNNCRNVEAILPHVRDLRRLGSAAYDLSNVACGILDGYWETCLKIWDVCAGLLILEEAGGVAVNYRKDRGICLVAGNQTIVKEIRSRLETES